MENGKKPEEGAWKMGKEKWKIRVYVMKSRKWKKGNLEKEK
jgi:hypothetical protein